MYISWSLNALVCITVLASHAHVLVLQFRLARRVEGVLEDAPALITLDDAEAVKELLELMNLH